jgi:broad specificity phosphatase PhoE
MPCRYHYSFELTTARRVVVSVQQTTPILVVSHLSTLQVLFGYFVGCPVDSFATLSLPRHTVVQLTPNQYGWQVDLIPLHGGNASPVTAKADLRHPSYGP